MPRRFANSSNNSKVRRDDVSGFSTGGTSTGGVTVFTGAGGIGGGAIAATIDFISSFGVSNALGLGASAAIGAAGGAIVVGVGVGSLTNSFGVVFLIKPVNAVVLEVITAACLSMADAFFIVDSSSTLLSSRTCTGAAMIGVGAVRLVTGAAMIGVGAVRLVTGAVGGAIVVGV